MIDLIDRHLIAELVDAHGNVHWADIAELPSEQPEQTKMIKEIRKWINSGNRGSADYFIVDKIEEIINEYERRYNQQTGGD